ncbi:MAG TPA: flagellar hook-associated protein FlgK [Kineosporiaceae bacterium]|nr:flagellar hook-associated protein FlgK [Kineosporiaceae bacterium]
MSGFSSLNTAVTGLAAAQRAMDVTGQNIVNANTPGYARQRVQLAETATATTSTLFTGSKQGVGGVTVDGVARMKDAFVEAARAAAGARQAALTSRSAALTGAQQLLAEPGLTGLQATMDDFYAAWHDLGLNPSDVAAGSVVLQKGVAVTDQLRSVASGFAGQWTTSRESLKAVLTQANQAARDLADVNGKISAGLTAGRPVNELMDQRDILARTLGTLVGGAAVPGPDGQVSVSVNGVALVAGTRSEQFTLAGADNISGAATDPPRLMWGTTPVPVDSGAAAGHLAVLATDLPALTARLDAVATGLRDVVNAVHQTGYTSTGDPGGDFFSGTDALTLKVVPTAPSGLAVTPVSGTVDGSVAMQLGDLSDDRAAETTLGRAGPSAQWRDLTTLLGVQVQSLKNAGDVQDSVVSAADAAVHADSGVNLDEEMTNMLQFQRAYQAAARLVTTVDEMFDTLVNRTGTVGR